MLTKKIGLILAATTFAMAPLFGLVHADDASSASDSSSAMGCVLAQSCQKIK